MENAVSWFEIPATDLKRAKTFYESVFQIQMHGMTLGNGLKMALFPVQNGTVGGALCEHPRFYFPGHQGTLVYLNGNPDLELILDRIRALGVKVLIPKTQISPERGQMALFGDSEGNRDALHSVL